MRLTVTAVDSQEEQMRIAAAANKSPRVPKAPRHDRKLAVVGGGPGVKHNLAELRAWEGDIWAVNHTANWLIDNGIDCVFYTVETRPVTGIKAKRALLSSGVHADTAAQFQDPEYFDLYEVSEENGVIGGTTSATRAPMLAVWLGYGDVSFFGCDGSFAEMTHINKNIADENRVLIKAAGRNFVTNLAMMLQSEELTSIISEFPEVFHCRSRGLLAAMLQDDQWQVIGVNHAIKDLLETKGMQFAPLHELGCTT